MHVGVMEYAVAAAAVLVGSVVQGSIGFGLNLFAAPIVALVVPAALPATMVLVATPVSTTTAVREHHALDRHALPWMLLGAVPGTALGLVVVREVNGESLAIVVGAITLAGVALSVLASPLAITPRTATTAGFLSNIFGTAASVGGPPVALLFQHRTGPVARATLGAFFAVGAVLALIGYVLVGKIDDDHLLFALALGPFMVAGLWLSRHLHVHVDGGWLRPAVLGLSAVTGMAAIVRGWA